MCVCVCVCMYSGGKRFFSSPKLADRLWGPRNLLFNIYQCSFPAVKRSECAVNHSSPSSVQVQNEYIYRSIPRTRLHEMERNNFKLTFTRRFYDKYEPFPWQIFVCMIFMY